METVTIPDHYVRARIETLCCGTDVSFEIGDTVEQSTWRCTGCGAERADTRGIQEAPPEKPKLMPAE